MIGILDSGLGGLTVAAEIKRQLPNHDCIYFGDTARMPYGGHHSDTINAFAARGGTFLKNAGVKMVVVSCHTLSSVSGAVLKKTLDMPVFTIADAAIEAGVAATRKKRLGILASRATVLSRYYEDNISRGFKGVGVFAVAAPLLVALAQEGWIKRPETAMIVKKYLHPLKTRQIDAVVLGCPQLTVLKTIIMRKAGRQISVVDGIDRLVGRIKNYIGQTPNLNMSIGTPGNLRVYVSEKTREYETAAHRFFSGRVILENVGLLS